MASSRAAADRCRAIFRAARIDQQYLADVIFPAVPARSSGGRAAGPRQIGGQAPRQGLDQCLRTLGALRRGEVHEPYAVGRAIYLSGRVKIELGFPIRITRRCRAMASWPCRLLDLFGGRVVTVICGGAVGALRQGWWSSRN
jgi:hypothetical protein